MPDKEGIKKEILAIIEMNWTPKCGWNDSKYCPEHGSCEDAQRLVKLLDVLGE